MEQRMEQPTIRIVVATHKRYRMPNDPMYLPLHVGAEGKKDRSGAPLDFGYQKDNTGDNISTLNPSFCELTGLYWAWKNLDADYIGLVHYRRYFGRHVSDDPFDDIMTQDEIAPLLEKIRVFVPKKRRYFIESLYSHYAHTHYAEQLDITRKIIFKKYPDYITTYDRVVHHTSGYMFNMMIMDRKDLNAYCSWLFDILFTLQDQIHMPDLSAYQGRFYGRISELIFNVWLEHQIESGVLKKEEVKELPYMNMEKTNWIVKGRAFLAAKFLHKKYKKSF